jgi:hypothetical protein
LREINYSEICKQGFPFSMVRKHAIRPRPLPVCDLLRSQAAVADCLERQRGDDRLLARVRDLLGPAARTHCVAARAQQGVLTVTADSPSWATRLRYRVPELLADLPDLGLAQARVLARPQEREPQRQSPLRLARLPPAVVAHLLAAADGCADPGIGEVFRRLARRGSGGRPASG